MVSDNTKSGRAGTSPPTPRPYNTTMLTALAYRRGGGGGGCGVETLVVARPVIFRWNPLLAVIILLVILAACASNKPAVSHAPVRGGIWTDDLAEEPDSLIPNASASTYSDMVDQALYTPLFYGDTNGNLHPALATAIPTVANGGVSADLKTWTFHLRPGLKWSDGQPLDARDVDFSWRLWMNPQFTPASLAGINLISSTDIAPNNLSITFHLKQPYEPFLTAWTDGIHAPLPAHYFQKYATDPSAILTSMDDLDPPVASGPFMMSDSVPDSHFTVVRNPNFYLASKGYPYLDEVIFRVVPDPAQILKDMQTGSVDSSWSLNISQASAYRHLKKYQLTYNAKTTNFEALYFNFHNPILSHDMVVREAISLAINYQALIKTDRGGYALSTCIDHSPALHPGYQAKPLCPTYDPAGAEQLLAQDGWKMGKDHLLHKGKETLSFNFSTTTDAAWQLADAAQLQQDFQAIGIKLVMQNYPASTFYWPFLMSGNSSPASGAASGRYDIAEFQDSLTYDANDSTLFACNQMPPNGFNIDFYCNKQLDQLFQQEQQTASPTARQQIFDQEHQLYLTNYPFIVLYEPVDLAIHKTTTDNYDPAPEGAAETINIWQWWCNKGQC